MTELDRVKVDEAEWDWGQSAASRLTATSGSKTFWKAAIAAKRDEFNRTTSIEALLRLLEEIREIRSIASL